MVRIMFKNGDTVDFDDTQYNACDYDGRAIIVRKHGDMVAVYNFDVISSVVTDK